MMGQSDRPLGEAERARKQNCEDQAFVFHAATGGDLDCSCGFHRDPGGVVGAESESSHRGRNGVSGG